MAIVWLHSCFSVLFQGKGCLIPTDTDIPLVWVQETKCQPFKRWTRFPFVSICLMFFRMKACFLNNFLNHVFKCFICFANISSKRLHWNPINNPTEDKSIIGTHACNWVRAAQWRAVLRSRPPLGWALCSRATRPDLQVRPALSHLIASALNLFAIWPNIRSDS